MEVDSDDEGPAPAAAAAAPAQAAVPQETPHHILLVENLPAVSVFVAGMPGSCS